MNFVSLIERDVCPSDNDFNGDAFGARISSIFVILAVSGIGAFFPLVATKCPWMRVPSWMFFVTRFFGSGVIVATGFIHLLADSSENLTDPCLGGVFEDYPWAEGIALMGVFFVFLIDIFAHHKIHDKVQDNVQFQVVKGKGEEKIQSQMVKGAVEEKDLNDVISVSVEQSSLETRPEEFYVQIVNSFVLEFGIVFHSVFVGLSLAVAGDEFRTLYVAISFHQFFEGLALGSRFATTQWPTNRSYTPWLLSLAYTLVTPIAIAIGIGVRYSYPPGSRIGLIVTGVFDAVCAGILLYNGMVELMAYDFLYSSTLKGENSTRRKIFAYILLSLGACLMALIGRWA